MRASSHCRIVRDCIGNCLGNLHQWNEMNSQLPLLSAGIDEGVKRQSIRGQTRTWEHVQQAKGRLPIFCQRTGTNGTIVHNCVLLHHLTSHCSNHCHCSLPVARTATCVDDCAVVKGRDITLAPQIRKKNNSVGKTVPCTKLLWSKMDQEKSDFQSSKTLLEGSKQPLCHNMFAWHLSDTIEELIRFPQFFRPGLPSKKMYQENPVKQTCKIQVWILDYNNELRSCINHLNLHRQKNSSASKFLSIWKFTAL